MSASFRHEGDFVLIIASLTLPIAWSTKRLSLIDKNSHVSSSNFKRQNNVCVSRSIGKSSNKDLLKSALVPPTETVYVTPNEFGYTVVGFGAYNLCTLCFLPTLLFLTVKTCKSSDVEVDHGNIKSVFPQYLTESGKPVIYTQNVMVTFTCVDRYRLQGNSRRTCLESGDWSGSNPRCGMSDIHVLHVHCMQLV